MFITILICSCIVIYLISRNRRAKVVTETLEKTRERTKKTRNNRIVSFLVSAGFLIWGIIMLNSSSVLTILLGVVVTLGGIVISLITLISMQKAVKRAKKYENMSNVQYRQHQIETSNNLKTEAKIAEFGTAFLGGYVGYDVDTATSIAEGIHDGLLAGDELTQELSANRSPQYTSFEEIPPQYKQLSPQTKTLPHKRTETPQENTTNQYSNTNRDSR